jgi:hypothetical protein
VVFPIPTGKSVWIEVWTFFLGGGGEWGEVQVPGSTTERVVSGVMRVLFGEAAC